MSHDPIDAVQVSDGLLCSKQIERDINASLIDATDRHRILQVDVRVPFPSGFAKESGSLVDS